VPRFVARTPGYFLIPQTSRRRPADCFTHWDKPVSVRPPPPGLWRTGNNRGLDLQPGLHPPSYGRPRLYAVWRH